MSEYSIAGIAASLILVVGCKTTDPIDLDEPVKAPPSTIVASADSREAQFQLGRVLLENGKQLEAMRHFAYLRDHARSADERNRAVIGLAMALQDSGNNAAALGALEPLPELPQTELEAMKCFVAGELFLLQGNARLSRVWLTRGLSVSSGSQAPHRAVALFNLGKALLAEEHLLDAQIAFEESKAIYAFNGDERNVEQCREIVDHIRRVQQ